MGRKKARSSATAEKVTGNIYMLWEILLRVPLKHLVRFKCVSKQWQTLISDEQFRDSHSLHQQRHQRYPNSLIFSNVGSNHILSFTTTTTTPTLRVLNFDFLNQPIPVVVRSCNGLLLCRGYNSTYFICNPITRDCTTLNLDSHPFTRKTKRIHLYLAFDPSISPRYKVVSVAGIFNSVHHWVFHVYTFKTRCCIGPGVSVTTPFALNAANGVYCNGAIHWCTRAEFSVYFDVDTQCLKNYPMPLSERRQRRRIGYFGESGGRLHLMLTLTDDVYDLFELNEDYSGWSLRHHVDLKPLLQLEFPIIPRDFYNMRFQIVRAPKDKKEKSSMLILIVSEKGAVFYDPVDKTSTKLCDFEMDTTISFRIAGNSLVGGNVLQHFENLVQP